MNFAKFLVLNQEYNYITYSCLYINHSKEAAAVKLDLAIKACFRGALQFVQRN